MAKKKKNNNIPQIVVIEITGLTDAVIEVLKKMELNNEKPNRKARKKKNNK